MKAYDKEEYKEHLGNLSGEYSECYDKIEGYIKICFKGSNESEEQCVYQILDELIKAQKSNQPLTMVIGNNLKEYCDKYIKLYQKPNDKFLNTLQTIAVYAVIMLILTFVKSYKIDSYNIANNLSFGVLELLVVIYGFVWNVARYNITKIAIKNNKKFKNLDLYLNIIFVLFLFPIINISTKLTNFEVKIPLILFVILIAIVVLTFVYINKKRSTENLND